MGEVWIDPLCWRQLLNPSAAAGRPSASAAVAILGGCGCASDAADKDAVTVATAGNSPPPLPVPDKSQVDTFRRRKWVSSWCLLRTSPVIHPRGWH